MLGDIIPPKRTRTSSRCSRLSSTYVSLACSDFQRPCRWKTLSFTPLFAAIVAPPDRRECKPNLDGSGRRLCRSWQKAPLIVEPLIGLLGATSFQEPFPRNGLENNIF